MQPGDALPELQAEWVCRCCERLTVGRRDLLSGHREVAWQKNLLAEVVVFLVSR